MRKRIGRLNLRIHMISSKSIQTHYMKNSMGIRNKFLVSYKQLIHYFRIIKRVWDLIIDSNRHLEFAQEHGTLAIAQTSILYLAHAYSRYNLAKHLCAQVNVMPTVLLYTPYLMSD